jgi:hypothetical protein
VIRTFSTPASTIDLRLAHLRDADADGAELDLPLREDGTLVGLGVGTELRLLLPIEARHLVEVRLHGLDVDDERRRGKVPETHRLFQADWIERGRGGGAT